MGKKRNLAERDAESKQANKSEFWCYYCKQEARDETTLCAHQRAKHFRCPICDPKYPGGHCHSLGGLVSHMRRSHNKELTEVPGAMEGRRDPAVEVDGMVGIPPEALGEGQEVKDAPLPWIGGYRIDMDQAAPAQPITYDLASPAANSASLAGVTGSAFNASDLAARLQAAEASPLTTPEMLAALRNPAAQAAAQAAAANVAAAQAAEQAAAAAASAPPSAAATAVGLLGIRQTPVAERVTAAGAGMPIPFGMSFARQAAAPVAKQAQSPAVRLLALIDQVEGNWEDSSGHVLVIRSEPNCTVTVRHESRGEESIKFTEFIVKGKFKYAGQEGRLDGNTMFWGNGSAWSKC